MAKRKTSKKKGEKDEPSFVEYHFMGGPKNGDMERLSNHPLPYVRFATPEWCTYRLEPDRLTYSYVGADPVPRVRANEGSAEPWVPGMPAGQTSAIEDYRGTPAFLAGQKRAERDVVVVED